MQAIRYGSISVAVILVATLAAGLVANTGIAQAASQFELARDGAPADPAPSTVPAPVPATAPSGIRVSINDNGLAVETVVDPAATTGTVEQLLALLKFSVAPEDVVFPSRSDPAPAYGAVIIRRAPGVMLSHDGKQVDLKTRATTVGGLLSEKGVTLKGDDRVEPASDAAIVPNLSVRVVRVTTKVAKEKEAIAFKATDKDDASMYQDDIMIAHVGKAGTKQISYKLTLEDGRQVKKEKTGEQVLAKPTTQITLHGTKERPKTASAGPFKDLINAAALKYDVSGVELMSVMLCESGGNQWAKDKAGVHFGLFQYTTATYKAGPYGNRDIYDPEGQIFNTAYYWSIGRRSAWGC